MDILYTCDNNYVWQMGISMISLFVNNKDVNSIKVHLIGESISKENKEKLISIANKYNRELVFYNLSDIPHVSEIGSNGRWPSICFARLFACDVLKNLNRVLYIDCDTIILKRLDDLFTDKYTSNMIYGAKDFIGNNYKRLIGMPIDYPNVNGGVLLFNYETMRKLNSSEMIMNFLNKYRKHISYADQDVLNGTFYKHIGYLDAKYNVTSIMKCFSYKEIIMLKHPKACYSESEVIEAIEGPTIIHFTGNYRFSRPWNTNSNHPYKKFFYNYKKESPWSDMNDIKSNNKSDIVVANAIRKLPAWFSCNLLGFLYCHVRPMYIWFKSFF